MLYEIKNIKQHDGEPKRRWFFDHEMDLYVWLSQENSIIGFQLCYDKLRIPRALTWHQESGFQHNKIDGGEGTGFKAIRLLIPNGKLNMEKIIDGFSKKSNDMPAWISAFIRDKMIAFLSAH